METITHRYSRGTAVEAAEGVEDEDALVQTHIV